MSTKEKISKYQFTYLVIQFTIGSSILIVPSGLASEARQDAWIASIISVIAGLLLVWLYNTLGKRYPDMNLVKYTEMILGKYLGMFASFLFIGFSFLLASLVLRNIGDFITTQVLIDTPISIIHIFFLINVIMASRYGIECIARASEILLPWITILLIILVLFIMPDLDYRNALPILESGIKPILRGSIPFIGTPFLELVVFLMIYSNVNRNDEASGAFYKGTLIGGGVLTIIVTFIILTLGADFASRNLFPTYVLGKKISLGFLERIEVAIAVVWIITVFFKLVISYFVSAKALAQILKLKDYRHTLFPLAMIMVILALVSYPNIVYFLNFVTKIWPFYALTIGFIYPLSLLIVGAIKKI